jgi:hypothetical protein
MIHLNCCICSTGGCQQPGSVHPLQAHHRQHTVRAHQGPAVHAEQQALLPRRHQLVRHLRWLWPGRCPALTSRAAILPVDVPASVLIAAAGCIHFSAATAMDRLACDGTSTERKKTCCRYDAILYGRYTEAFILAELKMHWQKGVRVSHALPHV